MTVRQDLQAIALMRQLGKSPLRDSICEGGINSIVRSGQKGPFHIEIVVPRCCERANGDLSWIQSIIHSSPSIRITVSVYYKCPHCLPANLHEKWREMILSSPALMKQVYFYN